MIHTFTTFYFSTFHPFICSTSFYMEETDLFNLLYSLAKLILFDRISKDGGIL